MSMPNAAFMIKNTVEIVILYNMKILLTIILLKVVAF